MRVFTAMEQFFEGLHFAAMFEHWINDWITEFFISRINKLLSSSSSISKPSKV